MATNRLAMGTLVLLNLGACADPAGRPDAAGSLGPDAADGGARRCEAVDANVVVSPDYADMKVTASGFNEHEGQTVFLVTSIGLGGVLATGTATVRGGGFAVQFPNGYKRSLAQQLIWFIDADGDGSCNADAGDHAGYLAIGAADPPGALELAITDNHVRTASSNVDVCNPAAPFGEMLDVDVTGRGFEAHDGRRVRLLTRTGSNGAIFGAGETVVAGGRFAFHFPKGYQRSTYQQIFLFVDVDGDSRCVTGVDHPGFSVSSAFNPTQIETIGVVLMEDQVSQGALNADVCAVMNGCELAP